MPGQKDMNPAVWSVFFPNVRLLPAQNFAGMGQISNPDLNFLGAFVRPANCSGGFVRF
jgi:hypothetical protein